MGVFRNASIRTKITALTMLMGLSLLVLATGAFVWSEISFFSARTGGRIDDHCQM
jgi:hypothetical protein